MRFAVLVFPGTWSDRDCQDVLRDGLGHPADLVWHRETNLDDYDAVIFPGGFSYGDYLRCGAIARFSPVMDAVHRHVQAGRPVFGSCNGFQILCEAGLLPGALLFGNRSGDGMSRGHREDTRLSREARTQGLPGRCFRREPEPCLS